MFIPDPASAFFIADLGSRADKIPDPRFRIRSRIKEHKVLKNKIRSSQIPDPGSWIWIFFSIPYPGSGGQKIARSRSRIPIRNTGFYILTWLNKENWFSFGNKYLLSDSF